MRDEVDQVLVERMYADFAEVGTSVFAGKHFDWNRGDVFVVPSRSEAEHHATRDADLFLLSDAPVIEKIGLARAESTPH